MKDITRTLISSNRMDFPSWTSLIREIEETSADDSGATSRVYESFLSEYPLCYGYWEKYANHKARLCSVDQAVEVYEEAVKVATYSVNLWANYCSFGMQFYEDLDDVRRLYERGLTFVGKDYLCNTLWDQYLAFEHSHKQWNRLVGVYIKSLRFPTKKLHSYYQSFKKLVTSLEEEIKYQNIWMDLTEGSVANELGDLNTVNDSRIRSIISFLLDQPAALYRGQTLKTILTIGEYFYRRSSDIDEKISCFESGIRRPYFHVKPLDSSQLQTWHRYLDFVETQEDFDWTVKLYERCLIPCANYPEFWVRYIELMEASGAREIATHAIERAVTSSLKRVPQFREYCAKVKERIGDASGARSSLQYSDTELLSNFVDNINQQANMEKRLGNIGAAYSIYDNAIQMLKDKEDLHVFCLLHLHFARFAYLVTGELGAAREVFIKGISRAPHCKSLFEGLITFMSIHGGTGEIGYVDSIVERAIVPESGVSLALSLTDRRDVSNLFLQFVDLCGTIHEIRRAWARHLKLFPPAQEAAPLGRRADGPELLEKTKELTGAGDPDLKPGTGHADREASTEEDDARSSKRNLLLLQEGPAAPATKSHPAVAGDSTEGSPDRSRLPSEEEEQANRFQAIRLPAGAAVLQQEAHSFSSLGPAACSVRGEGERTPPLPGCKTQDDLRPSLESLSICLPDEGQESSPSSPRRGHGAPQPPCGESGRDVCSDSEAKTAQHRASTMPATPNSRTPEQNLRQEKVNAFEISQLPAEEAADPKYPRTSEWHYGGQPSELQPSLPGYAQTPQHQQWQVPMQFQYPPYSGFNPQAPPPQAYAYQPQFWQPNIQMPGQIQGQYQMTAGQGLPPWPMFWQAQSLPQSGGDGSQHQTYQYHLQDGHAISPEFWHYYQQQLYYMQHLQQGSIQVQQMQEPGPQQKNAPLQHDPLRQQQQEEQHQEQHLQLNILQLRHLQKKMEMDHLQWQGQQQELRQAQDSHLQHHSQPRCQPDDSPESSPTQDPPKTRQDQLEQYVQHQSIQQKDRMILSRQEHQQQMYLPQLQQQLQKQEIGTLRDAKTSRESYNLEIQAPTRVAEEDGAVHPIPEPPNAPIQ